MFSYRRCLHILFLALVLLFNSCAGMYFRPAGKAPPPRQYRLCDWPYQEYWTGIVFNGAKIGFSHISLAPSSQPSALFDIRSEAAMRIRFLAFDKKINLKSFDQVNPDLSLANFDYEYDFDESRLKLSGRRNGDFLEIDLATQGQSRRQTIPVEGELYPTSIINLYPLMHGLEVGRAYSYTVYDGETQTVSTVEQKILAYEESDLYPGQAFKIKTRLHGQEVTTWMDADGRPLLEMSLGGVIISALENKPTAMKYLAQAAVNKAEALLDFSLIKSDVPIRNPAQVQLLEVALAGIGAKIDMPGDDRQQCRPQGREFICRIQSKFNANGASARPRDHGAVQQFLLPSYIIPSNDPQIGRTAKEIVGQAAPTHQKINELLNWIQQNIEQAPVDVFSALDVLSGRKAECQGHTFLYAAFARSLNIPTRVVNGIVYSEHYQGFLYHTWAESLVGGHWIAVDPTFAQIPADATHIKLIQGENISDLLPLVDLIGQIKLRIIRMENSAD